MPSAPLRSKKALAAAGAAAFFVIFLLLNSFASHGSGTHGAGLLPSSQRTTEGLALQDADLKGHTIMPKLGNETAKAELGRAAWKLLHTTMARFPDTPTKDESAALKAYVHLFQRLYPCGECASHFRKIIDKYPPQVATRSTAAAWACHVHNEVNKSLNKPIFDCSNIGDFYDCGCADGEIKSPKAAKDSPKLEKEADDDGSDDLPKLKKEGLSRGG